LVALRFRNANNEVYNYILTLEGFLLPPRLRCVCGACAVCAWFFGFACLFVYAESNPDQAIIDK
jgi:hypothetical protein